jgi:hypothetical protein
MKHYLIALQTGGLMEDPVMKHSGHEWIEADSRDKAVAIYNKKHHCFYFYGACVAEEGDTVETLYPRN